MDREQKKQYLARLEQELPAMVARLSQLKAEMRGLKGGDKDAKGRKAVQLHLEINGMKNTIRDLKKELR
jgi:hypothetical protein